MNFVFDVALNNEQIYTLYEDIALFNENNLCDNEKCFNNIMNLISQKQDEIILDYYVCSKCTIKKSIYKGTIFYNMRIQLDSFHRVLIYFLLGFT